MIDAALAQALKIARKNQSQLHKQLAFSLAMKSSVQYAAPAIFLIAIKEILNA
jgi:hypothetical protein